MELDLDLILRVIGQIPGADLSIYEAGFLSASIHKRMAAAGDASVEAYVRRLSRDRSETAALSQSLNITYSRFFRNPLTFALLAQEILPNLLASKHANGREHLRIWSAACAAGQEAYSVAILLEHLGATLGWSPSFRIIATDRCPAEVAAGQNGVYDVSSVLNVPLKYVQDYFSLAESQYTIRQFLKDHADFSVYDLLDERSSAPPSSIFGDFDLVFCCNLLFYYRPETRRRILSKVCHAVAPGGYLVLGESEADFLKGAAGFAPVLLSAGVFHHVN